MKTIIILLTLFLFSCKNKITCSADTIKEATKKDSLIHNSPVYVDSALFYLNKEMEASNKRNDCEITYLKSGNDKYRILGNKYGDSVHYWYSLLHKIANKKK